jgi:hypothetical protein
LRYKGGVPNAEKYLQALEASPDKGPENTLACLDVAASILDGYLRQSQVWGVWNDGVLIPHLQRVDELIGQLRHAPIETDDQRQRVIGMWNLVAKSAKAAKSDWHEQLAAEAIKILAP